LIHIFTITTTRSTATTAMIISMIQPNTLSSDMNCQTDAIPAAPCSAQPRSRP
jgi:hypothetical protein